MADMSHWGGVNPAGLTRFRGNAVWIPHSAAAALSFACAPSDRAELVGLLIDSLDENVEQGVEAAWLKEIDRRAQELESGAVRSIPWELVRERFVRAPRG